MPRQYSSQKKQDTLTHLAVNRDNVVLTSLQTGVSERTIHRWKQRQRLQADHDANPAPQITAPHTNAPQWDAPHWNAPPPPDKNDPPPPPDEPDQERTILELFSLRNQLMQHVFKLTESLSQNDEFVNHRAVAITRLLDRIIKLDAQLDYLRPAEQVIRVEYQYPDKTIHSVPPWWSEEHESGSYNDTGYNDEYGLQTKRYQDYDDVHGGG